MLTDMLHIQAWRPFIAIEKGLNRFMVGDSIILSSFWQVIFCTKYRVIS